MSITKNLLGTAIAALVTCNLPAVAAQGLSAQDRMFINDALKGGLHEVQMGRLGIQHGQSDDVKGLSQRLINDHNKASHDLEALAKQKGVMLPADDAKLVSSMPLAQKTGSDFDMAFAKMIVEDHQKDIAAFEKEISSGTDPDVKSWASNTLPTLRKHLADAQDIVKAESQTVAK
jgi:putative membrane protein